MNRATFQFLGKGSNGVSILAHLDSDTSPYKSLDESDYGGEIKTILIKLVALNMMTTSIEVYAKADNVTVGPDIRSLTKSSIVSELNMQTDIALKTLNYLEPLCPIPVWYEDKINPINLETMIANSENDDTRDVLNAIKESIQNKKVISFSVIAMEFADNYKKLRDVYNLEYFYMTAYLILKLALDAGYAHGDYHKENIMINETKTNYFMGKTGAPLLIDFGLASKIQPDILKNIKMFINNKQYTNALELIGTIPRSDGEKLDQPSWKSYYGYLLTGFAPDANERIDELFMLREESIKDTIKKFDELHNNNPSIPLLPLSNSAKNNIYSGTNVHNEIITINYYVSEKDREPTKNEFKRIAVYFLTQNKPLNMFVSFCYNYIYILHNVNVEPDLYSLYALVALTFVKNFQWSDDENSSLSEMQKFFILVRRYLPDLPEQMYDVMTIKNAIIDIYPLFENIEIKSYANIAIEYAINQAKNYQDNEPIILLWSICTKEQFYTDPYSVVCELSIPQASLQASQETEDESDLFNSRIPSLPSCVISG
jgi:hypothetical protein